MPISRSKVDLEAEIVRLRGQVASLQARIAEKPIVDERLSALMTHAPILLWSANADLRFEQIAGGLRNGCMVGEPFAECVRPSSLGIDPLVAASSALNGTLSRFSGKIFDVEVAGWIAPTRNALSRINGIIGIAVDESARRAAEREVSTSFDRYLALFDTSKEILFVHSFEGALTSVHGAIESLLDYPQDEALAMDFEDLLAPESKPVAAQWVHSLMAGTPPQSWEATAITKTGKRVPLEVRLRLLSENGRPVGVEGIARDISDRRALEEQVRQSQKMDAIGVLAGGIAHDFNNLLTGILGYAYLLQSDQELSTSAADALDVIIKSGQRAAQLTAQLLGFARRGKRQEIPVDLHTTAKDVVGLLQRTIDKRIRIVTELQATHSHVSGDPNQLYQLLLNLCLNARDAMPSGGELRIRTRIAGPNLILSVSDTGVGIPPEIRERIFEPFFTTKPSDKGTGMGLAMVYGIARNHGGTVDLETEVGEGSTFQITLPLCAGSLPEGTISDAPQMGTGRILVIDDEEVVRRVVSKMLRSLGYHVVAAGDTSQAIRYYKDHYKDIDLVILDMIMPKMSGKECFFALKESNPTVRAVLSSGYARDGDAESLLQSESIEFLQKPYHMEELAAVIRRALGRTATS